MKIMLDNGAKMPTKAHNTDAGYDLYVRDTQFVPAKESATFDTGVRIGLPAGKVGMIKSKSGLNVRYGITSEGVVDSGFMGSIVVKLYNHSGMDYLVNAGDKITQLVILDLPDVGELELVESVEELYGGTTERKENGFGSTGR